MSEQEREDRDEVELPQERVEDLEPEEDEEAGVKGGYSFKQGWPTQEGG